MNTFFQNSDHKNDKERKGEAVRDCKRNENFRWTHKYSVNKFGKKLSGK